MSDTETTVEIDLAGFREVVRHPLAHARILGQYRIGEYAGVVALTRLLSEMEVGGKLRTAMDIHCRDEERHSRVFTEWIRRLDVEPAPMPADLEGYFANSPEEFRAQRQLVEQLPPEQRRIIVFAAINAIERLAATQFDTHLPCLERREDVEALKSVIEDEKFHLSYVEAELARQQKGEHGALVTTAVEQARARFAQFSETRQRETREAIERILGAGG